MFEQGLRSAAAVKLLYFTPTTQGIQKETPASLTFWIKLINPPPNVTCSRSNPFKLYSHRERRRHKKSLEIFRFVAWFL